MTERIDLDELDVGGEDEETEEPNRGDWLWRGEGSPDEEPERPATTGPAVEEPDTGRDDGPNGADAGAEASPAPHVPRSERTKPVGIPARSGGAGAGDSADAGETTAEPRPAGSAADGPHGGGPDEMTIAFTYRAAGRLETPAAVFADASSWADWIGIVGDVGTHAITNFQRTNTVDADFFTGSGTSPAERLREIDRTSMFYAERLLLIGLEEEAPIAEAADWEFLSIEDAAEAADWGLEP
ncbi:hypothetical protein GWG54_08055 [Natronococcus sp. JC468]|uniref:DUF7124 domain-containing protein n=1 Tax=Natronococcus sp. JC468 TaxID=1961921 RepID=UPI00143A8A02|nr:hypothetical protein [Natronococcus sp. JC468]NKE35772.1 hypothetical protein [Natronococcus sp. JC468]